MNKLKSDEIMGYLKSNENHLGKLVTAILINHNPDGTSSGDTANLLTQYSSITLEDVVRQAHVTFQSRLREDEDLPFVNTVRSIDPSTVDENKNIFSIVLIRTSSRVL